MTTRTDDAWTDRAAALTAGVYAAAQANGHTSERRERVKAVLTCLLLDPAPTDLIDMLGVAPDETNLAYRVANRLRERSTA